MNEKAKDAFYERVEKRIFREETFALYKQAKSIVNKVITYELPEYGVVECEDKYIIEDILSPLREIEIIESDREDAFADEGIIAFRSVSMLIVNTHTVSYNLLDECAVIGLLFGEKVKNIQSDMLLQQCRFIYVVSSNPCYCSENNVLYTKDKSKLIAYAMYKPEEEFEVDDCVRQIGRYAFWNAPHLKRLIIGKSIRLEGILFDKGIKIIRK